MSNGVRGLVVLNQLEEARDYLGARLKQFPVAGMITGTGLGSLTDRMALDFRIPYEEIPHMPRSTIAGHKGTLVAGRLADQPILAMEGRFHLYEGYSPAEITFPVRVMALLGVKYLLISSAAGGLNPQFETGDLMVVTDHINLSGSNPLIGPNLDSLGPRFPDMAEVYDRALVSLSLEKAVQSQILIRQGVYVGVMGPSLETPAETRFLRMIGADAVGMSTVPEAIVGVHCGLSVGAIVVITNVNLPDCMAETSIEAVVAASEHAGSRLGALWEQIVGGLPRPNGSAP
jgi:purine-nucleoside phosphorylase